MYRNGILTHVCALVQVQTEMSELQKELEKMWEKEEEADRVKLDACTLRTRVNELEKLLEKKSNSESDMTSLTSKLKHAEQALEELKQKLEKERINVDLLTKALEKEKHHLEMERVNADRLEQMLERERRNSEIARRNAEDLQVLSVCLYVCFCLCGYSRVCLSVFMFVSVSDICGRQGTVLVYLHCPYIMFHLSYRHYYIYIYIYTHTHIHSPIHANNCFLCFFLVCLCVYFIFGSIVLYMYF
jgi:hypothetical protein